MTNKQQQIFLFDHPTAESPRFEHNEVSPITNQDSHGAIPSILNDGWVALRIKDMIESSVPGDWGKEGNPEHGIPVLRSTNFRNDGSINFADLVFRIVDTVRLTRRRVTIGTILVEKSGGSPAQPAGRIVYCDREFNGTASNFIEVVTVKPAFDPHYVAFYLYYLYQVGLVLKY